MTEPLPIAVIIPHGGLRVPPEVADRLALTEAQIFNEADAYTAALYDFGEHVLRVEQFPYARAIIDVNRPASAEAHHRLGDAAVKLRTSYGAPVYRPGHEPDAALQQALIDGYWQPWHDRLAAIAQDPRVKLVIDGHSMAALGPAQYDDPHALRPRAQVANFGDAKGGPFPGRRPPTAPAVLAHTLALALAVYLGDVLPLADVSAGIGLNAPFIGGEQMVRHGGFHQPWLMIEVNRALYVGQQDASSPVIVADADRIAAIREGLWASIVALAGVMGLTP